ncbi:MAG: Na+/H+ antiporter subunit E [Nocardioides alkalitolerans]
MSPQMKTTRSGKQRPARYRSVQWPMVLVLTLVWWVLWGSYSLFSLLGGVAVAVSVSLVFPLPPLRMRVRVHPWALLVLLARFLWDVLLASLQVAWLTLFPPKPLTSALVEVKLRTDSDFVLTVVAELLSLVPGTVVVEAHRASHTLFLHAIDVTDEAGIERVRRDALEQEARVHRAFKVSDEDLEEAVS